MGYQMVTWPMKSCDPERCCEAVRSAILATAWLLVLNLSCQLHNLVFKEESACFIFNKKAVLSQRWPRDARYVSRSWAVAEIWSFEIIRDGGGRHLRFIRIDNSAIRSAVNENPTLEPNIKWIGSPVAEIWPFAYGGGIWNPHFWGKGRS